MNSTYRLILIGITFAIPYFFITPYVFSSMPFGSLQHIASVLIAITIFLSSIYALEKKR